MQKINFQNLPSTATPINSTNLNQLQANVENDINSKTSYSSTETIIGKYNNKPLYRKIIQHVISTSTEETEPIGVSNIQNIVHIRGWMINQYGYFITTEATNFVEIYGSASNLQITSSTMRGTLNIEIEYTKTTD